MKKNELVLEKVRSLSFNDLSTKKMLFRLTQLEDSALNVTAESEDVTDAMGSPIMTMYRAKRAEYSATNSVFSLGLAGAQFGSDVVEATSTNKIQNRTFEILTIPTTGADAGKITLTNQAVVDSIKYIYAIEDNKIGTAYEAGAAASATEFVVDYTGDKTVITVPTGLTGSVYVEYDYETEEASMVINSADEFPKAGELVLFAIFRDVCDENKKYSGTIICPRAKIDPTQIEIALTTTGKHSFTFQMNKAYCSLNDELFRIVVD